MLPIQIMKDNYCFEVFTSDSSDDYPKYSDNLPEEKKKPINKTKDLLNLVALPTKKQEIDEDFLGCFQEVLILARAAIQPWWNEGLKEKSEKRINKIEEFYQEMKNQELVNKT